tara:strand:+ start:341 stop:541 length:201 start_codon:yes stop_codon:yes gene_type:complete
LDYYKLLLLHYYLVVDLLEVCFHYLPPYFLEMMDNHKHHFLHLIHRLFLLKKDLGLSLHHHRLQML